MAVISNVPELVDKKGGNYSAVAPRLEPGRFNKWKKRMLSYLIRMEPYYIQCIKDGSFKQKMAKGGDKPEAQWTTDDRRVDEEEVSDDEEETQVNVLMALADDELSVGKNHARNGEWIDITMKKVNILLSVDENLDWQTYRKYINIDIKYVEDQRLNLLSKYNKIVFELNKCKDDLLVLKKAKIKAVTFQILNTKLTKLNHALQDQLKEERIVNKKWFNSSNKVSQCNSEQIPNQKKKIHGGEQITKTSSSNKVKENPFIPASLDYDHEMVPKSKDWVERLNLDSKLPNFNTARILVLESQVVNDCLQLIEASTNPKSSKESGPATISDTKPVTSSVHTKVKTNDQESKIDELTKLPESSKSVKSSKQSQDSKPNGRNPESSKPID
ncbi:hypothetical protein Tco_0369400 [Tanacetum coccineum]